MYKKLDAPSENVLGNFVGCIWVRKKNNLKLRQTKLRVIFFLQNSFREWRKNGSKGAMLDYGVSKYGKSFVEDVRAVSAFNYSE